METVTSTTDSVEAVNAVNAILADKTIVEKSASAEKSDETPEVSDTAETDLDESQDAELSPTDEGDDEETKDAEKPKKKGGFQKRIERFQKQLSQKDQEIEYLRKVAFEAGKTATKADQKEPDKKIEVLGKPKADSFDSHEDYVDALTDWKIEQREKANEQKAKENQVRTEFQKKGEAFQTRIAEFKKSASDFDELMEDVSIDVPVHVQEIFLTSENGPALMYELAKNQKELERISKLSPMSAALEMGKIEAKFTKSSDSSTPTKTTKAPEPIKTVGSKGGSIKKSIDDPSLTQREFEKLREAQIKAARALGA